MDARVAGLVPVSLESSPVIEAYKKDVDRTLIIENLKLSPSQRVDKMSRRCASPKPCGTLRGSLFRND